MYIVTPAGLVTTPQVGSGKPITNLNAANFKAPDEQAFLVKNDSSTEVELEVKYAQGDDFVATYFHPGWNEDSIREIKATQASVRLLWGR